MYQLPYLLEYITILVLSSIILLLCGLEEDSLGVKVEWTVSMLFLEGVVTVPV